MALKPAALISAATWSDLAASISVTTTNAPSRAKYSAQLLPIP